MRKNIGVLDKGIRLFVATFCGMIGFTREPRSALNVVLIILAAYLIITTLSGICGIYYYFGWNTREKD